MLICIRPHSDSRRAHARTTASHAPDARCRCSRRGHWRQDWPSHCRAAPAINQTQEGTRMATRKGSGTKRQERIQREQHRPEQNKGYDEAVKQGGPMLPNDTDKVSYLPPEPPQERRTREQHDVDERETQRAIDELRVLELSAD